MLGLTC